jgi:hypothetical protein
VAGLDALRDAPRAIWHAPAGSWGALSAIDLAFGWLALGRLRRWSVGFQVGSGAGSALVAGSGCLAAALPRLWVLPLGVVIAFGIAAFGPLLAQLADRLASRLRPGAEES